MLAEFLGYEYRFKRPEEVGPFFREYGVDLSTRSVWAGHGGRSKTVAGGPECKGRREAKFLLE